MQRIRTMVVLPCLLLACASSSVASSTGVESAEVWDGEVRVHGALRAMFHEGQFGPTVTLDAVLPASDLYAVGALANLSGEITVVAGKAYLSYPAGATARTETSAATDAAATLLVASNVPRWRSVTTETAIPFEKLDDEIARLAASVGLTPQERFPFLLRGDFEDLQWHVIDGRRLNDGGTSHEDHLAAAVKIRRERASATLVGFYSSRDQGVFTHMGSRTHVHCVVDDPVSSGHVDHVVIPAGTKVEFPMSGDGRPNEAMQRTGSAGR